MEEKPNHEHSGHDGNDHPICLRCHRKLKNPKWRKLGYGRKCYALAHQGAGQAPTDTQDLIPENPTRLMAGRTGLLILKSAKLIKELPWMLPCRRRWPGLTQSLLRPRGRLQSRDSCRMWIKPWEERKMDHIAQEAMTHIKLERVKRLQRMLKKSIQSRGRRELRLQKARLWSGQELSIEAAGA